MKKVKSILTLLMIMLISSTNAQMLPGWKFVTKKNVSYNAKNYNFTFNAIKVNGKHQLIYCQIGDGMNGGYYKLKTEVFNSLSDLSSNRLYVDSINYYTAGIDLGTINSLNKNTSDYDTLITGYMQNPGCQTHGYNILSHDTAGTYGGFSDNDTPVNLSTYFLNSSSKSYTGKYIFEITQSGASTYTVNVRNPLNNLVISTKTVTTLGGSYTKSIENLDDNTIAVTFLKNGTKHYVDTISYANNTIVNDTLFGPIQATSGIYYANDTLVMYLTNSDSVSHIVNGDTLAPYSADIVVFVKNSTANSIHSVENTASNLIAFPNPTTGNVTIKFETNKRTLPLIVYDLTGRVVHTNDDERSFTNQVNIDLTTEPKGIYIARVGDKTFKISVQ